MTDDGPESPSPHSEDSDDATPVRRFDEAIGAARLSNHADTTYFNADGIHLNAAGEAVVWELLQPKIEEQLAA